METKLYGGPGWSHWQPDHDHAYMRRRHLSTPATPDIFPSLIQFCLCSLFFFFLLFPHIFYQLPSGPSRFDRTVTPARCPWDRTHRAPCQRNGAKRWSPPNSEHAVAVRSERQQELRCCPGSTRVWFPFVCRPVSLFPPVCADCHGRQSSCGVKDIEHRIESIAFDPDTGSHFP